MDSTKRDSIDHPEILPPPIVSGSIPLQVFFEIYTGNKHWGMWFPIAFPATISIFSRSLDTAAAIGGPTFLATFFQGF